MTTNNQSTAEPLSKSYQGIMATGFLVFAVGLFAAPERIWSSWLVSVCMLIGLAMSGPVLIAIVRLCAANWADRIVPIAKKTTSLLPLSAGLAILCVFGASTLYDWFHMTPENVSSHMAHKLGWLNLNSFILRSILCFVVWALGAKWMHKKSGRGRAGVFMVLFGFSFSIFSFDWLMSLEPTWFSTMFGVYCFAGLFLSGAAAITLVVLRAIHLGAMKPLSPNLAHDLGKLMFAFSFFWGYIWYCQYMLIWYTDMPEETSWFATRMTGSWATLSYLSLILNFVAPFLILLPAPWKANPAILGRVALILLVGRWLDLYIIITPTAFPDLPPLGLWEIGPPLAVLSAFFWIMSKKLPKLSLAT